MVKTLDIKTSKFLNLRKLKEDQKRYTSVNDRNYNEGVYMCDCDTFGGGDPPCDCNR